MIKLSQILKAVNTKLKETFPKIEIDSKDLSEKFNRPSFRTELDGLKTSAFMTTFKERNFTIRIYFFTILPGKGREERLKISGWKCFLRYIMGKWNFCYSCWWNRVWRNWRWSINSKFW